MNIEDHLLYAKDHEWVSIEEDIATVGISDYAQDALGDITYIELPGVGEDIEQFEEFASIESVKAASDIFAPISGKVLEVNTGLESDPGLINKSCYDKGWIAKIQISDSGEQSNLMTAGEYESFLESIG